MPQQRIDFWKGDYVGAGPAQKKININWLGALKSAQLVVVFGGKLGWQLQDAELNGKKYYVSDKSKPNDLTVSDVKDALINGENVLVVHYTFNPLTVVAGDQTTLTAYVIVDSDGGAFSLPSISQWIQDINTKLKDATVPTLVIIGLVAAIVIAIAVIVVRFRAGGLV